jgi:hypothetical protein
MRKDERGSILIEFVGSFLLFVLLIMSILTLVNIITVKARMHYALTQTANTVSMYGYVLYVTGVSEFLMGVDEGASRFRDGVHTSIDDINKVLDGINNRDFAEVIAGADNLTDNISNWGDSAFEDPKATIQLLMQAGLSEATGVAFELFLRGLMKHYLSNGEMSGSEYLQSIRINSDLQFHSLLANNNSVLLNQDGNVRITVQYDIDYSFLGLRMPWGDNNPRLRITQSAMTKMWLGGSGDGYDWSKN